MDTRVPEIRGLKQIRKGFQKAGQALIHSVRFGWIDFERKFCINPIHHIHIAIIHNSDKKLA
jgi:hypothetical protein